MIADACNWPRGVTVSTLDSESSDRGSNPREALNPSVAPHVEVRAECKCPVWARVSLTAPFAVQGPTRTYGRRTSLSDTVCVCDATRRVRPFAQLNLEGHGGVASTALFSLRAELYRCRSNTRHRAQRTSQIPVLRHERPHNHDPGRTRTCNLWFRRPTPYPLGHRAMLQG